MVDTNVFISGIFFSGNPDRILRAICNDQFEAFCSSDISSEYHTVFYCMLSKGIGEVDQKQLDGLLTKLTTVDPGKNIQVCRDPNDDKFIECAVEARAFYIVSGDKDLLSIDEYDGIEIVTAADFCERYL